MIDLKFIQDDLGLVLLFLCQKDIPFDLIVGFVRITHIDYENTNVSMNSNLEGFYQ